MAVSVSTNRNNSIVAVQGNRPEASVVVRNITATTGSNTTSVTGRTPALVVNAGSRTESAVVVKRLDGSLTVQGLSNVNSSNLQDGYTIVYDAETNTWITQEIVATAVANLDGGTY